MGELGDLSFSNGPNFVISPDINGNATFTQEHRGTRDTQSTEGTRAIGD